MFKKAAVLTRPPRCAGTPPSTGKAAVSEEAQAYWFPYASEGRENEAGGIFQHPA